MLLKEAHLFIHILLIIENEISRKHQCQEVSHTQKNKTSRKKLLFGSVLDSLKGDRSCITKSFVYNKQSEVLLNIWSN